MDVEAWLRSLGLEQYEAAFRDNKIDGDILPKLTAEDLKDLGVILVGDRRRLLEAIAVLRAKTPTELEATAGSLSARAPEAERRLPAGERRYLTVLFCASVA
jgi:hypothetical protein